MKLENIERVSACYKEYQHLLSINKQIIDADKVTVQITTTHKVAGTSTARCNKLTTDVPLPTYDLLSIVNKAIDNKRVELFNLGVEDIELDSTTIVRRVLK